MLRITNFIFIIVLVIIFTNCSRNKTNGNTGAEIVNTDLAGNWISDSLLIIAEQTKSIFESQNNESTMMGFFIDSAELITGEAMLQGFTPHEGGYVAKLVLDTQRSIFVCKNDADNVFNEEFEIFRKENNLLEIKLLKSGKSELYRRVEDENLLFRKFTVVGKYKDKTSGKEFEFKENGDLVGFDGFQAYSIMYDFYMVEFDILTIGAIQEENSKEFHYKWQGDVLQLYEVETIEEENSKIGKLCYELLKQ